MENIEVENIGLIDHIRDAMSETEVKTLVSKGKTEYKHASPKTIRRWDRLAQKRINQLNGKETVAFVSVNTDEKKIEKVEKKKYGRKK